MAKMLRNETEISADRRKKIPLCNALLHKGLQVGVTRRRLNFLSPGSGHWRCSYLSVTLHSSRPSFHPPESYDYHPTF